ncbi:phage tail assembly protein [Acinetobacter radioresistens]|uniref:phage tail assembly protein n=1 Tax=Acinetobacter radioresistens TaxID=40216 RepID=UPI003214BAC5
MNTQDQELTTQITEDQALNQAAIKNPNEEVVELDYPIKVGDSQVTAVTVRKPNIKALSGTSLQEIFNYDVNALIKVLPRVTTPALTPQQVLDLDPSDFSQMGAQLVSFLYPKAAQQAIQEMMN